MVFLRHRTRLKSLLLAIIIIILGCQETTSPTCSEIACLTDTVVPALSCQTEECTVMYRDKMQSLIPTQQLGIALELARRYPNGQASHLCDWLTEAMDRESCEVWHRRPHLWTPLFPSRPLQPNQKKSASTPPGECSKHESPAACVLQVAVQLGEIGDLENIKQHCRSKIHTQVAYKAGLTPNKLTQECFFMAADSISRRTMSDRGENLLNPERLSTAVKLCREAGGFTSQCLMHQAQQIARIRDPKRIITYINAGAQALDESGARQVGDAFWSMTWTLSLRQGEINGAPAAEARSALWYDEELPTEIVLKPLDKGVNLNNRRGRCVALDEVNWRPFHSTPKIDGILALLAEAARQNRSSSLLKEGLHHSSKEVQQASQSWLALPSHQPLGCQNGFVNRVR